MKKIFLALMLMVAATATMSAYDFAVDGIYYKINKDSVTVSVTYKTSSSSGGNSYSGHVAIPAQVSYNDVAYTVTIVGPYAFYKCSGLTGVNLPNTVTDIKDYAFCSCPVLTQIDIPDQVTHIGWSAFSWCASLTDIYIPASVETIESSVFSHCYGLTSIVVDEDNMYYDSRENCNAIIGKNRSELLAACVNTVIPNSVKRLARSVFDGFTWLTHVDLPDSLEYIDEYAFNGCTGLTNIDIPNTVTTIADCAFAGTGLTEVELPESLVTLGGCVFMDCIGLTSLHIPAKVTEVGHYLLARTYNVTSITVDPANTKYDSRDNCNAIIDSRTNHLVVGCSYSTVPEGVISIEMGAFSYCDKMTEMHLPSTLYTIIYGAFKGCSSLTSIRIPEGVVQIGGDAFRDCTSLTSVILPSTVISSGTYGIGTYCFYGCPNLKDITCFAKMPPNIDTYGCFESSTYQNATLHVPYESLARYQSASRWRNFTKIVAIGDVDGNGSVNITDVTNLIDQLLSGSEASAGYDVNGDGTVGITDVTALIDMLLNAH